MELHLFGVTEDRIPWHTLAKLGANHEFTSEPWADANTAQGIGRPGKGKVLDSATVMDGRGNLHVLVVTDEDGPNKLWHAIPVGEQVLEEVRRCARRWGRRARPR